MRNRPKLIVIVGPTASGKSEFAVKLAQKINGEIISADSRQVYKELNIGSAKIAKQEMKGITHHCLNLTSVKKVFTVADFKRKAEQVIDAIYHNNKIPILVGGTGFYIKAVVDGLVLPEVLPNLELRKRLLNYSSTYLLNKLTRLDPDRAKNIERKNKRRLIRALEIIGALGKVPKLKKGQKYKTQFIGIKRSPTDLKKRIENRTRKMLKKGLVRETKKLRTLGLSWKRINEFGFEYKYPALFLQKKITSIEMIKSINKETINYTRRQMLWWKKDKRIKWQTTR